MTLGLFECLRVVGLQRHYARFNSFGIRRVAHLSGLTMEDYPFLGICSMKDRTQLFHLIQVVKTLDLESLEYEDCDDYDYNTGGGDEGYAVADNSVTFDGCGDPDKDVYDDNDEKGAAVSKLNAASFSKPSRTRRRLDFSCETIDHQQKLFSDPVGTVHVYANHNRNNEPRQGEGSDIPVQCGLDTGSAVVYGCKGHNNQRPYVSSHQSDHHTGANTKPDIMEGMSMDNCHTRLSPKRVSSHKPKPKPATMASKRFTNKPVGHKDRKGISQKEKLHTQIRSDTASDHMTKPTPVYESKGTAGYNYGLPLSSPPTPNKKQSGGQRISVCVRKRPLTRTECRRGEADVVTTLRGDSVIVHESKEAVDLTQYILQHRFYFDQVFGEETSNDEVYRRTAYPLVQHMLNGGKSTCFAYGQTGAGKTHTMLGSSPGRPGLYALAVQDIFAHLSATNTHSRLLVYVSFFEIYCGQLYDLLDHRKRLFAREDGQKVVHIAGLRDVRVDSVTSLLEVISQGTEERTQGTSGVNPLSSRSHALLQIQLRGPNQQIAGRMWFVDLAGSERASDSKEPDRQSRMEGAEINQSLLALKECIRSLDQEQSHTPFRQSKLTLVLKDSFIGDSMTCMIANISPGHLAAEHTLNTLRYADRVKELRGQGGQRGGRRDKTMPSPKRNLSNSNSSSGGSSVGTRGKSSPKKAKLGRQREAFHPTTLTSRLAAGGTILCSTPKNSRREEEKNARARNVIGLEEITPIRCLLEIGDKTERRERIGGREVRRRERYGGADSAGHPIGSQNIRSGLILGQETDEQLHVSEVQRELGFYHREKEDQQSTLKGRRDGERRWIEPRRRVESSRDTCTEVERLRERHLQKTDERDEERERHLRQYHQQLQQFMPSSASSSDHLFPASTCLSFSSSNRASFSSSAPPSSCSSLQHSSLTYDGLEGLYRARVIRGQLSSLPSGEVCLQTVTSPSHNNNKDEVGQGDSSAISEDWMVSLKGTEAGFGQDSGKSEKRRSLKARVEGEGRERKEDWRPAGKEGGGERRWAWVATAQTEQTERMTGARAADVKAQVFYDCDSEVATVTAAASLTTLLLSRPINELQQNNPSLQPVNIPTHS
ncbi:kinesin-like protein KIF24 [Chaetodon auriga]|uniref:kinesin-like protein KIF24 n=1 Tax=Chaetodon auriga TaxID=39042 RepID=UPI004032E1C2